MSETILIVDDEQSVRTTFHDWLGASGMNVEVHAVMADSGERAEGRHGIS